ncbi:hypothetical protein HO133_003880 [Letharia lupina]|uniref:DUF7907 domain-containing protein n=1 Tax=Letharia lupina TaxID=560253 RepID=A0A8H6F9E2_9LECA|nr:uncharacterized protein HO133_003880 [Letharia lupina]KAF6220055.1 hypothetical protein HO133_003880 [Letharia lupina]
MRVLLTTSYITMRTTIAAIATFHTILFAFAIPQPSSTSVASGIITAPSSYYLKTRVDGHSHNDKDNPYVSKYHAGAGTADLTLQSIDFASPAFFNSGYQEFNLDPPGPFGIIMSDYDNGGTGWNFVTTAPGYGDDGFFFDATGLQYEFQEIGFAGWLAYRWHGAPQLFWQYAYLPETLPSTCAKVELLPVAI